MTKNLNGEFIAALEQYINREGCPIFRLSDPATSYVTMRKKGTRGSPFSNQPAKQGDEFRLVGCHLGKKHLVFTFWCEEATASRSAGPHSPEYKHVEFTEDKAKRQLAGFKEWYAKAVAEMFETEVRGIKKPEPEELLEAREELEDYGAFS